MRNGHGFFTLEKEEKSLLLSYQKEYKMNFVELQDTETLFFVFSIFRPFVVAVTLRLGEERMNNGWFISTL